MILTKQLHQLSFSKRVFWSVLLLNVIGMILIATTVTVIALSDSRALIYRQMDDATAALKRVYFDISELRSIDQQHKSYAAVVELLANNPVVDVALVMKSGAPQQLDWTSREGLGTALSVLGSTELRTYLNTPPPTGFHTLGRYLLSRTELVGKTGAPIGTLVVGIDQAQFDAMLWQPVIVDNIALILGCLVYTLGLILLLKALVLKPMEQVNHKVFTLKHRFNQSQLDRHIVGDDVDVAQRELVSIEQSLDLLAAVMSDYERSRTFLTAVFDSVHDAIVVISAEGKIQRLNKPFGRIWGCQPDDFVGASFTDLIAPRYRKLNEELCIQALAERAPAGSSQLVTTAVDGRGKEFPVEVSYNIASFDQQDLIVLTAQDISERESQRQELIDAKDNAEAARRDAINAAKAKSNFLATMSHEIRTPMNGIVGVLDLLNGTVLNADQGSLVETAIASAESLMTVLNDILDFSKLEAGKVGLEELPFDLGRLVEDVTVLFSAAASEKSINLNCSVDPQLSEKVISDPTRLRQILSNVVGNAIKFTSRGEVNVKLRCVYRSEASAKVEIEVQDTGIGIAKELQQRLFQPFSQADASTTREFGGTGLGLAICKQLADLLGAKLWLESIPGMGSQFFLEFTVPLSGEQVGRKLSDKALHNLRVLVVDDNRTNRSILRGYFRHWGVDASIISNPIEALEELRTKASGAPYDVCITDYHMPEMDGIELAQAIKADPLLSNIEVVMLSSGAVSREKTDQAGVRWMMSKPVRQSTLMDILAGCIDPQAAAQIEQREEPKESYSIKALLVEDNPTNQLIASQMLQRMGVTVETATNGQAGLDRMATDEFDIVFMDCQMPIMDGYQATAKRRRDELESGDHATIIALTANALDGDQQRCLRAGMDDYLSKPVREDNLRAIIRKWTA